MRVRVYVCVHARVCVYACVCVCVHATSRKTLPSVTCVAMTTGHDWTANGVVITGHRDGSVRVSVYLCVCLPTPSLSAGVESPY